MERQLKDFSFFTWTRYQKITWSSGWDSPNVSYHSSKFGGHRYCVSVDISFFHFSWDHVIKCLRDFEDWVPPPQVSTLPSSVAIDIVEEQIQVFWICNVTTQSKGHETLNTFKVPPLQDTALPSLVAIGIVEE